VKPLVLACSRKIITASTVKIETRSLATSHLLLSNFLATSLQLLASSHKASKTNQTTLPSPIGCATSPPPINGRQYWHTKCWHLTSSILTSCWCCSPLLTTGTRHCQPPLSSLMKIHPPPHLRPPLLIIHPPIIKGQCLPLGWWTPLIWCWEKESTHPSPLVPVI
jgi:hypothetical protein